VEPTTAAGAATLMVGTLLGRARGAWFPILFVLLFAYIDFIAHHNLLVVVGGVALALAAILFWPDLAARLGIGTLVSRIPAPMRPVLFAVPGLAFLLVRGQMGTQTQAAPTVAVISLIVVTALSVLSPAIDPRLSGYYRVRDLVPRLIRMIATPALAIAIGFAIMHGGLTDMPSLLSGKAATSAAAPGALNPFLLVLASLTSTAAGFLLLREPSKVPAR
jgi:hypothetical protein